MAAPFYDVGVHVGQVMAQALGEAKTGTPQFILKVKILGIPEEDGGSYAPHRTQYERSIYMYLTEKTVEFVLPALEKLGFQGRSIATLDPSSPNHQSFVGQQIDLWCSHQDDNKGGVREKWSISGGPQVIESSPLQPKQIRQLDALFGKALGKATTRQPAPEQRPSRVDDITEITDDDIPF